MIKQFLATSLAVVALGGAIPAALAQDYSNGLQVSASSPQTAPSNDFGTGMQQPGMTSYSDDISLRGRLAAIPKGTIMMVRLEQSLSSAASRVGDPVNAVLESDLYVDNQPTVPAGSRIEGAVVSVDQAGKVGKAGALGLQFSVIRTPNGATYPIYARMVTADSTGVIKGDSDQARVLKTVGTAVGIAGAGTLAGTAAGGLMGSAGGGALFGLGVGSLAGMGYAVIREGKEVVIPSGARVSIVLDQPATVN